MERHGREGRGRSLNVLKDCPRSTKVEVKHKERELVLAHRKLIL